MYYRYYTSENPMSDWGHAMFVDNEYTSEQYGNHIFVTDGSACVEIESLADEIEDAYDETFELLPSYLQDCSFKDFLSAFNPIDIVDSAGAWDNYDMYSWFLEYIAEPYNIKGVITNDGAIILDRTLIEYKGTWR